MTDDELRIGPSGVDEELERLGRATERLRASRGFAGRVLAAVEAEATFGWIGMLNSAARRVIPLAAIAAAAAGLWAIHSEERANEAIAASYGDVEVEW
jgi:hypothetical protein